MSRLERLRSLVNQRMNAAAEDIGRMLEGKVSEYEEEARFFREENNSLQHKILKLASKSDVQIMMMDGDNSSSSENQDDSPQDQASTAPPVCEQEHQEDTPDNLHSRKSQKTQDAKDSESSEEEEGEGEDSESSDEGENLGEDQGEAQGGEQEVRRTKRKAPQLKEEKVKRIRN